MLRPFVQVDVFTATPMLGNPLAVVLDANGLDEDTMQRFARWTNLSETTFVLRADAPGASYRVRIYTPMEELPFAGHPSVGTAWALLDAGLVRPQGRRLVQQCGAGLLEVEVDGDGPQRLVSVQAPVPRRSALAPEVIEALPRAIGLVGASVGERPILSDVGARWMLMELGSRAQVRASVPDLELITRLSRATAATGLAVFSFEPAQAVPLELRAFGPASGVPEDPVTGSAQAAVGEWLAAQGRLAALGGRYDASQGHAVGRAGEVRVASPGPGRVQIGGRCCALIRGAVNLAESGT
ncbi:MAG: PhzF family phenazine biosynthesis protein [Xanthomonadales bacterium]|nr:Trans-2,3-dihydro-3-hydroxyanthranilate isomerase [Xanthomonadales bacterium]MCC6592671.1 PhzF family phenazine biosynthesis protein [Xanthomonadales bacterium]MCE7930797.1 PhzF family phenazine biosynthesis protein [Xanthomonadales bacterium PRO6]